MVSGSLDAALFFPLGEEMSVPPFVAASLEEAIVPLSFPLLPSKGIIFNILTSTGSDLVWGRGAGHLISFAFAIHSCLKGQLF